MYFIFCEIFKKNQHFKSHIEKNVYDEIGLNYKIMTLK